MENEIILQRVMPERSKYERTTKRSLGNSSVPGRLAGHSRLYLRYPLYIIGALWPLVLLAPHLPGIPRPLVNGLPWRQELGLSIFLSLVLVLHLKHQPKNFSFRFELRTLVVTSTLGLFVAWTWLSTAWAATPYAAVHLGMQWTIYLIFFLVMSSVAKSPRLLRASFGALAGIVCVLAISCAIESWFGAPLTDGNLRNDLKPLLRGSGGFGEIMAMAAIIFASVSLHVNRRRIALACGVTALLGWLATIQSLERAPLVGALAGFTLLVAGTVVIKFRSRRSLTRLSLLVGALACVLFFDTMPSLMPSASGPPSTVTRLGQNLTADSNTRVRFLFWGVGLKMLQAHPMVGVGGNNYETAFAEARAQFSADHPDSPLIAMNEELLTVYAHNEYLQLLAELGLVGFTLFVLLSLLFAANFWRALKHRHQALPILGAGGAMLAFAVSSGASGSSFRYFGGGVLFFFAAAIINRVAGLGTNSPDSSSHKPSPAITLIGRFSQITAFGFVGVMLLVVGVLSAQATGTILHGLAQSDAEPTHAEGYYRASLATFPSSTATHFTYGLWLYNQRRGPEAVSHLAYAVDHGFNSSICYAYLAAAQDSAGNQLAAERTFAKAVRVYPVSVFLRVRHSVALKRAGQDAESEMEFARALLLDARAARGWQQLIVNDIDAALVTAQQDTTIALPGELAPEAAVFEVLQENEQRFPAEANTGWRARMRTQQALMAGPKN